jgi:uncharacterized protein (DUF488 family)
MPGRPAAGRLRVFTVGHSTLSAQAFLDTLASHGIEVVADVRRFPGSRRHPHFGAEALAASLRDNAIDYVWLPLLGGRRRDAPAAQHLGWNNPSFRSYAAYTWSEEFAEGLADLVGIASAAPTAIMCSELPWWRCHRALISDVLRFLGAEVLHIMGEGPARPHPYSSPARVVAGELVYPVDAEPDDCCR